MPGGHAAYITCDEFERNVKAIANGLHGQHGTVRGAAERRVVAAWASALRPLRPQTPCHYGGKLGRYNCYGARMNHGDKRCISVSGLSIDAAIAKEVLCGLCHGNGSPSRFAG